MLALALSLLAPAQAQANCSVGGAFLAPADDRRAMDAPRFYWTGNCSSYTVQVSVSPTMTRNNSVASPLRPVRTWKPSANRWETMMTRFAPELYWRVIGLDANGNAAFSEVRRLETDWDDDLDGVTWRGGDCDDTDPARYPGAVDVLGDGIDQDCDGADFTCVDCTLECTTDVVVADVVWSGDTTGLSDVIPTCVGAGPDKVLEFTAPTAGNWQFHTMNAEFDTTLSVQETCAGPELDCDDDGGGYPHSLAFANLAAGQTVVVVISGFGVASYGAVELLVSEAPSIESDCHDFTDNDGDDLFDCQDDDCASREDCIEICGNGADDNGDFLTDCQDTVTCGADPSCGPEVCGDGIDNDADFYTDCQDFDCTGDASCGPEICGDGRDNDGDFGTDCGDSDCDLDPTCVEDCTDGIDNDGDFWVDCGDGACAGEPQCGPEDCGDGIDNDGDFGTDCMDTDCDLEPACAEDCTDGVDNDGDFWIDCQDGACDGNPVCVEDCTDGLDNDGDFDPDCVDSDCATSAECQAGCTDGSCPYGSFQIQDGPYWQTNPTPYSCVEACAVVFGGVASDWSCSTDPTTLNHLAFVSGWGDFSTCSTPGEVAEDFSAAGPDGGYNCGSVGCAYSAYVLDNCMGYETNWCWAN